MLDPTVIGPQRRDQRPRPLLRTTLGGVLRRTRREQGRTLADVARAAKVSMPYLSEVERGRKEASSEVLAAICGALRIDLADLLARAGRDLAGRRVPVARPIVARPGAARGGFVRPDEAPPDAVSPDAVSPDAVQSDAVSPDAVQPDAVSPDVTPLDAVSPDAVSLDAASQDAGRMGAAPLDAAPLDAAAPVIVWLEEVRGRRGLPPRPGSADARCLLAA